MASVLDNVDTVFAAGELYILGFPDEKSKRSPCSCGELKQDCSFWCAVQQRFESKSLGLEWDAFRRIVYRCDKISQIPRAAFNRKNSPLFQKYLQGKTLLYQCIADESGCEVIVDTGRNPVIAQFLMRNIQDFSILYMIRNGEDYLYSKLRRIKMGNGMWFHQIQFKPQKFFAPFIFIASCSWFYGNLLSDLISLTHPKRMMRLRYEDFCASPKLTLKKLGRFIDVDTESVIHKIETQTPMPIKHIYNGNMMSRAGTFIFNPSIGVNMSISLLYRVIFRLINWPLMIAYGYWGQRNTNSDS
ncbi:MULTISPECIES: sulfotransferase domain-containing protein [unclassified Lentimonas]|nr:MULTISPECIES: sulfotransferase domain-containing protein [unclassified Lentimonas]CAA6691139.1 Unannotated [Lentimonas sp. CC10]CAA6693757.1 Unannotated [Lentimonas sp. CC19]CAA7070127.1 Unannotated [Lentimonas sp. CC11]